MNYVWLRPLVEQFPKCAPSQFFIVDCLLVVDELLNDNLLMRAPENGRIVPTSRAEKVDLATAEAVRIRKCYNTLRYLYRNGATAGESRVVSFGMCVLVCPILCALSYTPSSHALKQAHVVWTSE